MTGTTSDFYCTKCGSKGIPLFRINGKQREAGHLKILYCVNCKERVNHAEVRPFGAYTYEDFEKEFNLGRFVDGNRVPINHLKSCSNRKCMYNVNGDCWNAKHDFNCEERR